jgi:hypothetical protein
MQNKNSDLIIKFGEDSVRGDLILSTVIELLKRIKIDTSMELLLNSEKKNISPYYGQYLLSSDLNPSSWKGRRVRPKIDDLYPLW